MFWMFGLRMDYYDFDCKNSSLNDAYKKRHEIVRAPLPSIPQPLQKYPPKLRFLQPQTCHFVDTINIEVLVLIPYKPSPYDKVNEHWCKQH